MNREIMLMVAALIVTAACLWANGINPSWHPFKPRAKGWFKRWRRGGVWVYKVIHWDEVVYAKDPATRSHQIDAFRERFQDRMFAVDGPADCAWAVWVRAEWYGQGKGWIVDERGRHFHKTNVGIILLEDYT